MKYRTLRFRSACEYHCRRSSPGMTYQQGVFQTHNIYKCSRVIGSMAETIDSFRGFDTIAMSTHIQSIYPIAICQRGSYTHPALRRTCNTVQQERTGKFDLSCPPAQVMKAS